MQQCIEFFLGGFGREFKILNSENILKKHVGAEPTPKKDMVLN